MIIIVMSPIYPLPGSSFISAANALLHVSMRNVECVPEGGQEYVCWLQITWQAIPDDWIMNCKTAFSINGLFCVSISWLTV